MGHDAEFVDRVAGALHALPGVEGVALGGSRAQGTHRPDSDWDFAIYYRGSLDVESVRAIGWDGHLSEVGAWGPVFNGGGAVSVDGRAVDIHYRDLDLIDEIHSDAEEGEFRIEPLLFHQAGIPTYILLAELAVNACLAGVLPRWEYPDRLKQTAPPIWWFGAELTLHYATVGHATHGRVAQCAGLLSEAACRTAHAILAHRGEWVTNEKRLLERAGLRDMDGLIAGISADDNGLLDTARSATALLTEAVRRQGIGG